MEFWVGMIVVAALVLLLVLRPALHRSLSQDTEPNREVQVFKDQLRELEADIERGLVSEGDAETTRTELSRRLLHAARREQESNAAAPGWARVVVLGALVAALGISVWTYSEIGAPGAKDQPLIARLERMESLRAQRPTQADAEALVAESLSELNLPSIEDPDPRLLELIDQLAELLEDRPNDFQGQEILAYNLAKAGRYADARKAQLRVIEIKGDNAQADDYVAFVEYMYFAAGGYVSPESERALAIALTLDETNPQARYYAGLATLQANMPQRTYAIWQALLQEGPEDAPWNIAIRAQIDEVAQMAGAAPLRGPSIEDIEAAGEMNQDDQAAMIQGMVNRLSQRLASQGGTAQEWAQLIRALGVLGETDRATAIWNEAQDVFSAAPDDIALIRAAAIAAGVAQE